MSEHNTKHKSNKGWILVFSLSSIFVITFWFWNYFQPFDGTFGDKFGVANSLFSGLAFAGIIITIYIQSKELSLQRKELKETRDVFHLQSSIMKAQQNDNTFFNLLQNHKRLVDSFKRGEQKNLGEGRSMGMFRNNKISMTDEVSGLETLGRIAVNWHNYLERYSLYFKNKVMIGDGNSQRPEEHFRNENMVFTLYESFIHIQNYIESRFERDKDFYYETLWSNQTYHERYLLQCVKTIFPERGASPGIDLSEYKNQGYIDFESQEVPEIAFNLYSNKNDWYCEVETEHEVLRCQLVNYVSDHSSKEISINIHSVLDFELEHESSKQTLDLQSIFAKNGCLPSDINYKFGEFVIHVELGVGDDIYRVFKSVGYEPFHTQDNDEVLKYIGNHNITYSKALVIATQL